jgi:hypothetical protein
VHVYPEAAGPQASFLANDLASVEWSVVQSDLPKMAVLMGEFGTFEGTFKDVVEAGDAVLRRCVCANACLNSIFSAVRSMEIQVSGNASAASTHAIFLLRARISCRFAAVATASAAGCIGRGTATNAQVTH